ncbi:MAG: PAS domain S-box protein [Acidobacteria bacterium]|nr:PAS domain S-box protein [Acidobacteriota bacterium]
MSAPVTTASPRGLLRILLLVAIYLAGAMIGLTPPFFTESTSLLWPPAGVALAFLLRFGCRLWPGVVVGAGLAALVLPVPFELAAGVAAGDLAGALTAAYLLHRFAGFRLELDRIRDVLSLIAIGFGIGPLVSAGIICFCLWLGGHPAADLLPVGLGWRFGEAMGVLILAPLLLALQAPMLFPGTRWRWLEGAILVGLVLVMGQSIHRMWLYDELAYVFAILLFPLVIWAALRFGQAGVATLVLIVAVEAFWGTLAGRGPFIIGDSQVNIIYLQIFLVIVASTGMTLAAVVTERRAAAESLRRRERQLDTIARISPAGIFRTDAAGRVTYVNRRCTELSGLTTTDSMGLGWADGIHPADRERVLAGWRDAVQRQESFRTEVRFVHPDGQVTWIIGETTPEIAENGQIAGYVGTMADITDLKRSAAALNTEKERLGILLASLSDGVITLDKDGRVRSMNPAAERLIGRPFGEIAGHRLEEVAQLLDEKGEVHFDAADWAALSQNGARRQSREAILLGDRGRQNYINYSFTPLPGPADDPGGSVIVFRDVTENRIFQIERQEMEKLRILARSHQEWQATFDAITDLISIHDQEHNILKANRAFMEYYKLTPDEVPCRKCYDLIHEQDQPIADCFNREVRHGDMPVTREFRDSVKGKVWQLSVFPYKSPDGEFAFCIRIAKDITERKDNEMKLILSDRLAALGQMAAGIAHEINNPLATISACAEGLQRRIVHDEYQADLFGSYLGIIEEEVARCTAITTNMLSFVRRSPDSEEGLNLNYILDRTIEMVGYQGRLKRVKVMRNFADPLPAVSGNEGELRQVFLAIVVNALDAMADRGTLAVETTHKSGTVCVAIHDSGPGIPAEVQGRIMEPFYSTKHDRGGTGLGLSIASRIITDMQGRIEVRSVPGEGASFLIHLPVQNDTA